MHALQYIMWDLILGNIVGIRVREKVTHESRKVGTAREPEKNQKL